LAAPVTSDPRPENTEIKFPMKKNSSSKSAFFNARVLIGLFVFLAGVFLALLGFGAFSNVFAEAKGTKTGPQTNPSNGTQAAFGPPDVVQMVGPVAQNQDLRSLPYIPPNREVEERRLTRYPHPETGSPERQGSFPLIRKLLRPAPTMPLPLLTFDGMNSAQSGCGCLPPDSDGDVGPNHYVNAVNTSIKIFDKSGNPLNGPNGTTFNSFFAPLGALTPCGSNQNNGDPFVLYDQMADRWVVSDFAFPSFPGTSFYQCIGVSQTGDPVSGGWFLYAVQVDPANPTFLGDYPKFALWSDAYYLTMNLFSNSTTFNGVRVCALDRASMITGGPTNAIGFTLTAADVGASYSFVAASFRAGDPPPAGRQEFVLAVDSPASGGVTLTQVHGRLFHVDFANPNNSTFGVGPNHLPNAEITVNGFVDAFTNTTTHIVPQQGTAQKLDTLGDKIMTPVAYQNRSGTESLWASQTVCTDQNCTGPTAVRWYQFNVTGGTFPATPVQQQSWTNGGDGLWRWMPSIAVDQNGNAAIGYSAASASIFPSIRYAGRLAGDPLNDLGQGEAIMTNGGGSQTSSFDRWGDYSMLTIDPADNASFWHVNEYYVATSNASWATRIGKFSFSSVSNPVPVLTSLSPSSKTVGSAGFTLTVNGSNFVPGATVSWNNSARSTTFVSSVQVTAQILTSDLATAGTVPVIVTNPPPGGGASNSLTFTINNPRPNVTSISPSSATAGGPGFTLTVNGSNFVTSSVVNWNGAARTTTFSSSTRLTAAISAADIATGGMFRVTVTNPGPGGGTSAAKTFTVNNLVPAISSISPSSATAGGPSFTLTVNGSNFVSGSKVHWNSLILTTTFVSSTQVTAAVPSSDIRSVGTVSVTVVNAPPGGGTSNAMTFTVNNPVPAISSISPSSATAGGPAFTLTVNGSNFVTGSVVDWNGSARTTTFTSRTRVTASISAADIATVGTASVTAVNAPPGGGTSNAKTFTINP